MKKASGFTLIELLIVVAIIAILAAIAVPNFLEAQTRSKISRAKADMRTVALAMEAYQTDYNNYPWPLINLRLGATQNTYAYVEYASELTTPVGYLSSALILDAFQPKELTLNPPADYKGSYQFVNYAGWWGHVLNQNGYMPAYKRAYCISSYGPDRKSQGIEWACISQQHKGEIQGLLPENLWRIYDPTNGTISAGDIGRWGGELKMANTIN